MASHLYSNPSQVLLPHTNPSSSNTNNPADLTKVSNESVGNKPCSSTGKPISTEKVSIGMDETLSKISSTSILPSPLLGQRTLYFKANSLPSSPTKASSCRSIAELKTEIQMMEEINNARAESAVNNEDQDDGSYQEVSTQQFKYEHTAPQTFTGQMQQTGGTISTCYADSNSTISQASSSLCPLKMDHNVLPSPPTAQQTP